MFISPSCDAGIRYITSTIAELMAPAFTSMDEYRCQFSGVNIEPVTGDFNTLFSILHDDELDGIFYQSRY